MTSICGNEDEELAVHVEPPSEFSFFLGTAPMTMISNFISYKQHDDNYHRYAYFHYV